MELSVLTTERWVVEKQKVLMASEHLGLCVTVLWPLFHTAFNPVKQTIHKTALSPAFYRWGNWGPETQKLLGTQHHKLVSINRRAELQNQFFLISKSALFLTFTAYLWRDGALEGAFSFCVSLQIWWMKRNGWMLSLEMWASVADAPPSSTDTESEILCLHTELVGVEDRVHCYLPMCKLSSGACVPQESKDRGGKALSISLM